MSSIETEPTRSDSVDLRFTSSAAGWSSIRFRAGLLRELRSVTVQRFLSLPRGGLEVGGVLYGHTSGGELYVGAYRELTIQYLSGPSFVLSPVDVTAFRELLEQEAPDPDDDGTPLRAIGWWVSHTRRGLELGERDISVQQALYAEHHECILLVIKPAKFDPAQAAIYACEGASGLKPEACCKFEIGEGRAHRVAEQLLPEPAPVTEEIIPREATVPTIERVLRPLPVYYPAARPAQRRHSRGPLVAALVALAGVFFSFFWPPASEPADRGTVALDLQVSGSGSDLQIRWNQAAASAVPHGAGELLINDGGQATAISLTRQDIRSGTVAYSRTSDRVEIRMRVWSPDRQIHEAIAYYVGAMPLAAKPQPEPQPERREEPVQMQAAAVTQAPQGVPTPTRQIIRRFEERTATTGAPKPELVDLGAVSAASAPLQGGGNLLAARQQLLPPPPLEAPAKPAKPAAGRAIWTGSIPRGGVLMIDGGRVSSGSVTGTLPASPARIRVYPADLDNSGLVVYSESGSRVEPPSSANGWNLTTYKTERNRARDVTVIEQPGPTNGWNRLVLKSQNRTVTVLVIEWESLQSRQ